MRFGAESLKLCDVFGSGVASVERVVGVGVGGGGGGDHFDSNSYRFATPGGRRGLQACGLWCVRCFSVRTTMPMLPTVPILPTVPMLPTVHMSFSIFRLKLKLKPSMKSMPAFFQNLLEIYGKWGPKSIQNGVPEGPWSVWEPFREAMLLPDRFFIDSGVHFGTLLEPCWAQKSLRN